MWVGEGEGVGLRLCAGAGGGPLSLLSSGMRTGTRSSGQLASALRACWEAVDAESSPVGAGTVGARSRSAGQQRAGSRPGASARPLRSARALRRARSARGNGHLTEEQSGSEEAEAAIADGPGQRLALRPRVPAAERSHRREGQAYEDDQERGSPRARHPQGHEQHEQETATEDQDRRAHADDSRPSRPGSDRIASIRANHSGESTLRGGRRARCQRIARRPTSRDRPTARTLLLAVPPCLALPYCGATARCAALVRGLSVLAYRKHRSQGERW